MAAELIKLEGLERKLNITVSAEALQNTYQKKIKSFAKNAKIKGFRPGKVPLNIAEQKFGKGLLHESAAQLIESSLKTTLNAEKIRATGMPNIDFDAEKIKADTPFSFTATFEVYPEIQLKDLTDVDIEAVSGDITESDINSMLVKLRTQHAEWQAVSERAAKLGDRVKIDFDGMLEDKPLENGSGKNHSLELGSKSMIPGFEDGIIGMKKDETKTINIAFPADYHVETLRAKPVTFTITLHEIEEPKLPALDERFAEKLGFQEGADALKQKVKENLETQLKEATKNQLKKAVLDKLREKNPIEIPKTLVNAEITHLQDRTRHQMQQYMGNKKKIDASTFPLSREPYVEEATSRVALGLLLAEVIKIHNITVDEMRVQARLKEMTAHFPNPSEFIEIFTKNQQMMSDIEAAVLEEQAIDALLEKARVTHVKKSYDAIISG